MNWKILGIVLITILVVENAFIFWGMYLTNKEIKQQETCLYDYCEFEPSAEVINGICYCYDYDVLGQLQVTKQKPVSMLE